ncbi:zinc ribbon-containing protein [Neptunomonas concharum]|uniref:Metalloendopeptidase n=1 Tax=Neptunomonas concharum TaxID=1031538 RepID=A0A5P1R7V5_9GAMM|nr:zinc ribbon-containing protein [Neptunomonas concharum]QEQ95677.1 metalloendopeptidase [Neptunomonas concharum]
MDKESKKLDEQVSNAPSLYNRVLDRLQESLEKAELNSWDYLQEKIEEAVELELAAEEMTRDEMDLLTAYLKRDLKQLGYYAHETGEGIAAWLNFDLNILEKTVMDKLLALADQTRIDQERLREQLANEEDEYVAGEVAAAGTFQCQACAQNQRLLQTDILSACESCGATLFKRISHPWGG